MKIFWSTINFGLLIVKFVQCETIVQGENGYHLIHIKGREPFMGNYIQLIFAKLHCIISLTVNCAVPLTGAEEIELIYKIYENDSVWRLTHYSNSGSNFTLRSPIHATVVGVVMHRPIDVVDVEAQLCCMHDSLGMTNMMMRTCKKRFFTSGRLSGKHGERQFFAMKKRSRVRRSSNVQKIVEFTIDNSPHFISNNITVHAEETLRIQPGTNLIFSQNTGITVHGTLQIIGTKYRPIMLQAMNGTWNGLRIAFASIDVAKQSRLLYLNISGSKFGIRIESLLLPEMENIISDGNDNGVVISASNSGDNFSINTFNHTMKKLTAINNHENGIVVRVGGHEQGHLLLEEIVLASNQINGLLLEGTVDAVTGPGQFFFNNSRHSTNGLTIEVHRSLFHANGQHALQMQNARGIQINCFSTTFRDHNSPEAILIKFAKHSNFLFDQCHWRNNSGAIAVQNIADSNLHLLNGNLTLNRGTTIITEGISGATNISIENNNFRENGFWNDTMLNSIIKLGMSENDEDTHIQICNNYFFQNAMRTILLIHRIRPQKMPANAKITIVKNSFVDNLSLSTVYLAGSDVNISFNIFNNFETQCELHFDLKPSSTSTNATNNYWGTPDEEQVMKRICDSRNDKSSVPPAIVVPFLNVAPKKQLLTATKQSRNLSKIFRKSLIIEKDEVVVFHEGSVLNFQPNHGIVVFGALHLLGQRDNQILLKSSNRAPWLGIILNKGGIIHANHCVLEDAIIGLNVSSSNITIENMRIVRPISAGILITTEYNGTFDLGESIIMQSQKSGIRILKRHGQDVLLLRNALILDCGETGIDFTDPAGKLVLQNIVLENSGLFAILLAQSDESQLDSIVLSNLTISKQTRRGNGGILLNLKSYNSFHLNTSNFISNIPPSVTIISKCSLNGRGKKVRKVLIEKNRFLKNENLIMRIALEGCESAVIRRNSFIRNNEFARKGTLAIYVSPQMHAQFGQTIDVAQNIFVENKGEWSLFASATNFNQFNGTIRDNRFNGNGNDRNALIVTTPYFQMNNNKFEQFDFDVKRVYNDALNVVGNYWRNDDMFSLRSLAQIGSNGRKRATDDCLAVSNCSNNGQCVGLNVCHCNVGYGGSDCSQMSCSALRNCSQNGYCIAPNVCKCFDGWQQQDCSEAACQLVNNCSGHGTCVSRNECFCEPMFEGADCSKRIMSCNSNVSCNNHGLCIDNECVCETGWTGSSCSRALCDQLNNCSGSGICIRPQLCECFDGFAGDDCSVCLGASCDLCDAKCIHGRCDSNTRRCICRGGWRGENCDICATKKCNVMSAVLYVLPTAAGIHQKDANILVYGNDLPFVSSNRYTCLYGSTATYGFYVSSSLVRCTIPALALPGRYLFNIIPYGSDKAIPFFDKRLIHFTLYNECNQTTCKGYCLGAVCVCPDDRDGAFCEQAKILPNMNCKILSSSKLIEAVEGEPYTVKMPSQGENTIFNVETDANGMVIHPNGMVLWSQPIGRIEPYAVNVTATSLTGGCIINWNLTVKPIYTPVITKVQSVDDTNMKVIRGTVNYNAKLIGGVPVRMLVYQNDKLIESVGTRSTANGHFKFIHHPFDEAIPTTVVVVHPGAAEPDAATSSNNVTWTTHTFDIEYIPKIKMKPGEQIEEEYQIRNKGDKVLLNCQLELIMPRDKLQVVKYEKIIKGIAMGELKSMKVTFAAGITLDSTTILLQFKCIDTPKKLIRQQIEVEREQSTFVSYPSRLFISMPPRISPKIFAVDIVNKQGYQFVAAPRISIRPDYSALFLISSKPSLENITKFNNPESTLTLFISYRPTQAVNWTTAGDLVLSDGNKELFTVEYRNYATSELFDFQITVVDELSALDATHVVSDAEVTLRNDVLDYDDKRHTKDNGHVVFFSIIEGTYQLTIKSPTHATVTMIVQPSFTNSSLAIFAPISSPYSSVVEDGQLLLEEFDEQLKAPFPKLHFTPSAISVPVSGTKEINLLISSNLDGPSDNVAVLPSVEIHQQHLPFTFATDDLQSGLGLGDGYHMKCKLSRLFDEARSTNLCTVFALQIPYIYMVPNSISNYMRNVMILADNRKRQDDKIQLCEVSLLQTAPKQTSIWVKTTIYCNCAAMMKERCRMHYVSATPCGNTWKYVQDDAVSLQATAMFIAMIAECRAAGVNFQKIKQFLTCAAALHNYCPISQQQPFSKNRSSSFDGRQRWDRFFDQKYFPTLKVLASQAVDTVALYKVFFERLDILLPFKHFEEINDRGWFNTFFESISESSEDGLAISQSEFNKLKDGKGGTILADRWNATIVEWSKISSFSSNANLSGMKFKDARELIISSDRLKALAKQYGADNPFALLHNYVGRLLSWRSEHTSDPKQVVKFGDDYDDICAYAYTLITPEKPYENNEFRIRLKVINKKKKSLESVKITLEMIQSHAETTTSDTGITPMQFRIAPVMLDGIESIDRTSKLSPNASFVATWNLKPVKNMRLIREAEYQAVLILKFTQSGRKSVQRIATQPVIFRPRPSLKIYYFISNLAHTKIAQSRNTSQTTFNVMIAFMNTGYSNLENIKVEEIRISVLSKDRVKNFIPYQINNIVIESGSEAENKILSDFHFTIANIESGKTVNAMYNITTDLGQRGVIRDFKLTTSISGELIELEDTQIFTIQQFISPTKFLISHQTNPSSLFYYNTQRALMRTISPLIFVNVNERTGISDGKPFLQQVATFRLNRLQQKLTSFYGRIPFPIDLENDFEVLRVNQIGKNGALRLVNPQNVWSSNTDREFLHFIDDNLSAASEFTKYEIIYGNSELFLRPRFEFPVYNIPLVIENWPHIGDEIARIVAHSPSHSIIRYELYSNSTEMNDYFSINPENGVINLKKEIQPEELKNSYCATIRAIDEFGRSETTALTVGFDGFFSECHKIVNFNSLQPFTFIPPQSHPMKPTTGIEANDVATKHTSEMTKLYRLPYIATSSLSSTLHSTEAKTTEGETSETDDEHRTTLSATRKHEYTKLIATQSISDSNSKFNLTSGSSSTFQLSSTVADSYFKESDLNDRVAISSTFSANSVNFWTGSTAAVWNDSSGNYQSSVTSLHKGAHCNLTSPTPAITQSSEDNVRTADIFHLTKIPSTLSLDEFAVSSEVNKNITEMACRLKDAQPIWGLICDLNKTSRVNESVKEKR